MEIITIPCGNVNAYLIAESHGAVLVDTGMERYRSKILNICKNHAVKLIILTHGHIDHVQNAAYLAKKLGCPVGISKEDMELLQNNHLQKMNAKGILGNLLRIISEKSIDKNPIPDITISVILSEEMSLKEFGIDGRVLALPGHTKGSVGIDVEEKFLFVGDALMNMIYPTTSMIYENEEKMLESAKRITSLGKRKIYFGHGKPVNNRNWEKTGNILKWK